MARADGGGTPADPKRRMVDVRPFKKDHVIPDRLEIRAVMYGFRYNSWHKDRIPPGVMGDLKAAYPEHFS